MKYLMFTALTEALLSRSQAMGKEKECQAFIDEMNKECPNWKAYEKAILYAYTDGISYGNWPWTTITVFKGIKS